MMKSLKILKVEKNNFNVKICKSLITKGIGLMFNFFKEEGILMVFRNETKTALHTFFVLRKIDIVYFNSEKIAVKLLKNVKPFRFYIKGIKSKYILEVKDCKNIKIVDKLNYSD